MIAPARLRMLPRWITAWCCLIGAIGLIVLGTLTARADSARRDATLDAGLRRVTSRAAWLVRYDDSVIISLLVKDPMYGECPQFAVLPGRPTEFTGQFSGQQCVPVDSSVLTDMAEQAAGSGQLTERPGVATDGRPLRLSALPFGQDEGRAVGAIVAVADASEAQRAHRRTVWVLAGGCVLLLAGIAAATHQLAARALRPSTEALEQQEVLLADAAHDLRTPVAALRALSETALLNPAHSADLLPRAVDLAQRMGTIVDGVLIRARLAAGVQSLEPEPVWLDQMVGAVVEETPADGAQVTLTSAPSRITADAALLRRAIGNLLDNALRHGKAPGQPAVVHITVAGGRVVVADHGPGVDSQLANGVFDRFRSTGGSSGLGLSIVRWVAEAHGGKLSVYNAEEGGAIFELTLPFDDA